jgi:hypothetical protein
MFLWESYLNKEMELINEDGIDAGEVEGIYNSIKKIESVKNINIGSCYSGPMDDGRDKIRIMVGFDDSSIMEDNLKELIQNLTGYDIEIDSMTDSEDYKSINIHVYKKFCAEKMRKHIPEIRPEIGQGLGPGIARNAVKIIRLGEE